MKLSSVRSQAASGVLPAAVGLVIALLAYSLIQTVPPAKGSTVPDSAFTFQRQGDSTTGAMLMDARVYQPVIGRFLQIDPTAGGSADMDHYGARDPISTLDLSGMYVVQGGAVAGPTHSTLSAAPPSVAPRGIRFRADVMKFTRAAFRQCTGCRDSSRAVCLMAEKGRWKPGSAARRLVSSAARSQRSPSPPVLAEGQSPALSGAASKVWAYESAHAPRDSVARQRVRCADRGLDRRFGMCCSRLACNLDHRRHSRSRWSVTCSHIWIGGISCDLCDSVTAKKASSQGPVATDTVICATSIASASLADRTGSSWRWRPPD